MKAVAGALARAEPVRLKDFAGLEFCVDPRIPAVARARTEVLARLKRAGQGQVVPVEFSDVVLTASCLAELLGQILRAIVAQEVPGRFVLGCDATGANEWDADAALRKLSERLGTKLLCAWEVGDGVRLVGSVDQQVRLTYEFLQAQWERTGEGSTARDLARRSLSTIQAASNRLAKLATLGLAYPAEREPVRGGGAQFRYVPVM